MPDLVGQRIMLNILGGILFVVGVLMMNGLFPFSLTGNGLYDSMIVIIVGVLFFIISKIISK